MNARGVIKRQRHIAVAAALAALACFAGCHTADTGRVQGYVEGEFVYVASPFAGQLDALEVARGSQVKQGELLFVLESTAEEAAREEAERQLAQARATWEDLTKGKRPSEIQSLEAQLKQAQAALEFSDREFTRVERLISTGSVTEEEFERVRSTRDQNSQRVAQLQADLKTARLGARDDQIAAAEATVQAREAALTQAQWSLDQKRQSAPQDAEVFDTLFQEGEWVGAGKPVVALLPPENVKVRCFVPETEVSVIRKGESAKVIVDGMAEPFAGRVSFISPRAEYTPPVIYSRESRSKLVFMVELVFDRETAAKLHPGQPVDVVFEGGEVGAGQNSIAKQASSARSPSP
jgi:HlyD family secretion protein